jgi:signal peptidase I
MSLRRKVRAPFLLAAVLVVGGCNGAKHVPTTAHTAPIQLGCPGGPCVQTGWYPVDSAGMESTLHCGPRGFFHCEGRERNRVKAVRSPNPPRRFDIVVSASAALSGTCHEDVLRVIGLPGEVWSEQRGFVYINGKRLDEPYVRQGRRDSLTLSMSDLPPKGTLTRIPKRKYLLMGDNRTVACDSRTWGLAKYTPHTMVRVVEIADYQGRPTGRTPRGYTPTKR